MQTQPYLQEVKGDCPDNVGGYSRDFSATETTGVDYNTQVIKNLLQVTRVVKRKACSMGLTTVLELSNAIEDLLDMILTGKVELNLHIATVLEQNSSRLVEITNSALDGDYDHSSETIVLLDSIKEMRALPAALSDSVAGSLTTESDAVELKKVSEAEDGCFSVSGRLLDSLSTLAGELVVCRNQLLLAIRSNDFLLTQRLGRKLKLITAELQKKIMSVKRHPLSTVLDNLPTAVEDLAKSLEKSIDFSIVGREVELDRELIVSLRDPLVCLVCNAVLHGIERPADRKRAGKPEKGRVTLRIYKQAGMIMIQVRDNGIGIDGELLTKNAISKGLVSIEKAQSMTDEEKVGLIFLSGFSKSNQSVNDFGRDISMSMAKAIINKWRGQVKIMSEVGRGTEILVSVPLTCDVMSCQIIHSGDERYAIPYDNLKELLRIPANQVKSRVEKVGAATLLNLRGNSVPLVRLSSVLETSYSVAGGTEGEPATVGDTSAVVCVNEKERLPCGNGEQWEGKASPCIDDHFLNGQNALNIVVVSSRTLIYGVIVDRLLGSEEIVPQALNRHFQQCQEYIGAAILSDGHIAMILDVNYVAERANLPTIVKTHKQKPSQIIELKQEKGKQKLLIFHNSHHEQFAVLLNQVNRVQKITPAQIESWSGKSVMQYQGGVIGLVTLEGTSDTRVLFEQVELLVIVCAISSQSVGLVAVPPADIVDVTAVTKSDFAETFTVDGRSVKFVDVYELAQAAFPGWFAQPKTSDSTGKIEFFPIMKRNTSLFSINSSVKRKNLVHLH